MAAESPDRPGHDAPGDDDVAAREHVAAGRLEAARRIAEAAGRRGAKADRWHFFALSCYLDGDMASAAEAWAESLAVPGAAAAWRVAAWFPAISRAARLAGIEPAIAGRLSRLLHACPGTQFAPDEPGADVAAAYRMRWAAAATVPGLLVATMPWSGGMRLARSLADRAAVVPSRFGLAETPVAAWVADALASGGTVAASPTAFSWALEDLMLQHDGGPILVLVADPRSAGCALVDAVDGAAARPESRFFLDAEVPDDWARRDDAARLDWMIDGCLAGLARWVEGWILAAARAAERAKPGGPVLRPLVLDVAAVAAHPGALPQGIADHYDVEPDRVAALVPAAVPAPPDWRRRLTAAQAERALGKLPAVVRTRFAASSSGRAPAPSPG